MILTEKQQIKFIERYKSIYGDTSKETGTGEIPRLNKDLQKEHVQMRVDFLRGLIGPRNCKKIYIHRGGRKEDYLHLAFNSLYANYGPTWVDENDKIAKEQWWLGDNGKLECHIYE